MTGAAFTQWRCGSPPVPRTAPALALLAGILAFCAAAQADPVQTNPGHLAPPAADDPHFEQNRLTLSPKKSQVVIRDAKKEWRKAGKLDKALTAACRAKRFREREYLLFRAIYKDSTLGVAFGHGLNIYDPDRKAKPGMIYLFWQGGTTACEVLTTANLDPNATKPAGK